MGLPPEEEEGTLTRISNDRTLTKASMVLIAVDSSFEAANVTPAHFCRKMGILTRNSALVLIDEAQEPQLQSLKELFQLRDQWRVIQLAPPANPPIPEGPSSQ